MARPIVPLITAAVLLGCAPEGSAELGGDEPSSAAANAQLASAEPPPDTPVSNTDPVTPPLPATPTADCPVAASRGWSAAVIGKPPGAGDRLRVHGTLVLAEGGWRARLERGPVLEMHPPIQRLELVFDRAGASGPREIAVHGEFPALSEYGAIDIRCGNRSLASITSVAWTENKIMDEKNENPAGLR